MGDASGVQHVHGPVKGINSINLTETSLSLVISTKSGTSASLRPLMMTAFNLTDCRFEDNAVSRALSTAS